MGAHTKDAVIKKKKNRTVEKAEETERTRERERCRQIKDAFFSFFFASWSGAAERKVKANMKPMTYPHKQKKKKKVRRGMLKFGVL